MLGVFVYVKRYGLMGVICEDLGNFYCVAIPMDDRLRSEIYRWVKEEEVDCYVR